MESCCKMVVKDIEKKVKVDDFFDLLRAPVNSWVEINGNNEFKINYPSLRRVDTLFVEGDWIYRKHYYLSPSLISNSMEKVSIKKSYEGGKYSKMIEEGDKG